MSEPRRRRRSTAETGVVYFVRQNGSMRVKIGTAHYARVNARLAELQRMNPEPLELLGACMGGQPLEADLHRRFAHLRAHGEWFEAAPELMLLIAALTLRPSGDSREEREAAIFAKHGVLNDTTIGDLMQWIQAEEARIQQEQENLLQMQLLSFKLAEDPDLRQAITDWPNGADMTPERWHRSIGEVLRNLSRNRNHSPDLVSEPIA
jgi:hypothetical protein